MKKVFLLLFVSALSISIGACNSKKENKEIKLENCSIHRDDEFGGAYIDISIIRTNIVRIKANIIILLIFNCIS